MTAEYYHRDSSHFSGFVSRCKICVKEYQHEYNSCPERKAARKTYNSQPEVKERLREMRKKRQDEWESQREANSPFACTKCGIEKPLTAEYFSPDSWKKTGFKSVCRACRNKQESARNKCLTTKEPACIYKIVNTANNKIYIGQTTRGELRWKGHLRDLRGENRKNTNHKLQADFNKFGEDAFEWSIIKEYPKDKDVLLLEEARTIVKYRKEGKDLYNITLTIDQVQMLKENK